MWRPESRRRRVGRDPSVMMAAEGRGPAMQRNAGIGRVDNGPPKIPAPQPSREDVGQAKAKARIVTIRPKLSHRNASSNDIAEGPGFDKNSSRLPGR